MRILIVEDSKSLVSALERGLKRLGYAVDVAHDGERGLAVARREPYDVIVLDIMLPLLDGMTILHELRSDGCRTPILLLTARDGVEDRVRGLREGADDYLVKPFAFDELVARLEALVRRSHGQASPVIEVDDLHIDTAARRVTRAGHVVPLKAREYALLVFLATRRGSTVSRLEIEDHLYGEDNFPMSNAVPSAISSVRAKLGAHGGKDLIHTRRGMGYVLDDEAP